MTEERACGQICRIQWRLLRGCPNHCAYCPLPGGDEDCILVKDRLVHMADKLLALPHASHEIAFTGGEPAGHPLFAEIIRRLLSASKKIHISVDTVGRQNANFFIALAQSWQEGVFSLKFSIHPARTDLREALLFLAALAEKNMAVSATLFWDANLPEKSRQFALALNSFRRTVPVPMFSARATGDLDAYAQWQAQTGFAGTAPQAAIEFCDQDPDITGRFCVFGADTLRIEPDGAFYGSFCQYAPRNPPLWQVQPRQFADVFACPAPVCELAQTQRPPRFSQLSGAYARACAFVHAQACADSGKVAIQAVGAVQRVARLEPNRDLSAIIMPADAADLASSIYSILIQPLESIEIIVIDAGMDAEQGAICQDFLRQYPRLVRRVQLPPLTSPLAFGLHKARGRHILFLAAGDALMAGALPAALAALAEYDSQIAVLAVARQIDAMRHSALLPTPGIFSGAAALQACFAENWGAGRLAGIIFQCEHLRRNDVDLARTGVCASAQLLAVFYAGRIAVLPEVACRIDPANSAAMGQARADLAASLVFLREFLASHALEQELSAPALTWLRDQADCPTTLCGDADISAALAQQPLFLQAILDDLAQMAPTLAKPVDFAPARNGLAQAPVAASAGLAGAPALSVIFLAREWGDAAQIARFCATCPAADALEIILIVENAQAARFADWPRQCPQLRLYLCEADASPQFLRVFATGQARGDKIAFPLAADPDAAALHAHAAAMPAGADLLLLLPEKIARQARAGEPDNAALCALYLRLLAAGEACARIYRREYFAALPLPAAPPLPPDGDAFALTAIARASMIAIAALAQPLSASVRQSLPDMAALWRGIARLPQNQQAALADVCVDILQKHFLPLWRATSAFRAPTDAVAMLAASPAFLRAADQLRQKTGARAALFGNWRQLQQLLPQEPLITAILPVYNQERFVGRAIASILAQNVDSLELIVINDASTDGTLAVCEQYARRDARVQVIDLERNRGQGHARNLALQKARGLFVTFVDADDYLLPGFLLSAAAQLLRHPDIDYVQGGKVDGNGANYSLYATRRIISGAEMARLYLAEEMEYWECWGKLYRRQFLLENDLRFGEHLFEDEIFLLNAYSRARKLIIDPAPAYVYEKKPHPDSAMMPIRWTHRHLRGFLARCAEVSAFMRDNPQLDGDGLVARRKLSRVYEYFRPLVLGYLAALGPDPALPDASDLASLAASPDFMRIFLEDYAALHIGMNAAASALPIQEDAAEAWEIEELSVAETAEVAPLTIIALQQGDDAPALGNWPPDAEIIVIATPDAAQDLAPELAQAGGARLLATNAPAGFALREAARLARGEYLLIRRSPLPLPPCALAEILAQGADAICLGKKPPLAVAPPNLGENVEAALAALAGGYAGSLDAWILRRDCLADSDWPLADAPDAEILQRVLLRAQGIRWLGLLDGADAPRNDAGGQARRHFRSILEKIRHATETLNAVAGATARQSLAESWLAQFFAPSNGNLTALLACVFAFSRMRENPALSAANIAILGAHKPLLKAMLLDYGRLWQLAQVEK